MKRLSLKYSKKSIVSYYVISSFYKLIECENYNMLSINCILIPEHSQFCMVTFMHLNLKICEEKFDILICVCSSVSPAIHQVSRRPRSCLVLPPRLEYYFHDPETSGTEPGIWSVLNYLDTS